MISPGKTVELLIALTTSKLSNLYQFAKSLQTSKNCHSHYPPHSKTTSINTKFQAKTSAVQPISARLTYIHQNSLVVVLPRSKWSLSSTDALELKTESSLRRHSRPNSWTAPGKKLTLALSHLIISKRLATLSAPSKKVCS